MSVTVAVPDASDVSSVAAPVVSPAIVAASFAPAIVIVTVPAVPSALANDSESLKLDPDARACTAEFVLSRLYVQVPDVIE